MGNITLPQESELYQLPKSWQVFRKHKFHMSGLNLYKWFFTNTYMTSLPKHSTTWGPLNCRDFPPLPPFHNLCWPRKHWGVASCPWSCANSEREKKERKNNTIHKAPETSIVRERFHLGCVASIKKKRCFGPFPGKQWPFSTLVLSSKSDLGCMKGDASEFVTTGRVTHQDYEPVLVGNP